MLRYTYSYSLPLLALLTSVAISWADPVISEFMAANDAVLADEDGDFPDWIEIHNPDTTAVNLSGWSLTDNSSNLTKWSFPAVTLSPGQYLVVFASGKDRAVAGSELHAGFKLSSGGEYLALVKPDGVTRTTEFAPTFPEQSGDISYGFAGASSTLVDQTSTLKYLIPTSGSLGATWTAAGFDDSAWVANQPIIATYASGDIPKNTSQSNTITSNLTLTASTTIQDINVKLDISHSNDSDLTVTLRSPAGTTITLVSNEGGSGNNFTNTVFDDEASASIENGSAPFNGSYTPEGNLSSFDGQNPTGTWVLSITDGGRNFFPHTGTLNSWSIEITGQGGGTIDLLQGVGYEDSPSSSNNYSAEIVTNLPSGTTSSYVRIPFTVADKDALESLILKMKYDDGFVAYINGTPVTSANAPGSPTWNSSATAGHDDADALSFVSFDISAYLGLLVNGNNILAVHMLNENSSSSDLLMSAELIATQALDYSTATPGYLTSPTPGSSNNSATKNTGPNIDNVTENPTEPNPGNAQVITADLSQKTDPVAGATLYYRVGYGTEVAITMNDSGTDGDALAGNGIWSATIPASAYNAGDMLRWYVIATDTAARETRAPAFITPLAPQYYGTCVSDGITTNGIKRFRWWVQNPDWYWTGSVGSTIHKEYTPCSIWYGGKFYDNVRVRTRGGSSVYLEYDKQSYHFNFHESARFEWITGGEPLDRINLNSQWVDQAFMRNHLSMGTFAAAGVTAPASEMVLTHRQDQDPQVSNLVEHPNEAFLERNNLDPDGALYKVYNRLEDATNRPEWTPGASPNSLVGVEKKTREDENNNDLDNFIDILPDSNSNRQRDLFDQLNIPSVINYMAASVIDQGLDVFSKNNFVYRDTNGTGEWQMIPWDRDVSWGPSSWNQNSIIYSSSSKSHPLFGSGINGGEKYPIFEAVIDEPVTREMFVRRLRTLMDERLQAPGTPSNQLILEAEINGFVSDTDRINTPSGESDNWVQHDKDNWGKLRGDQSGSELQSFNTAISAMVTTYLPNRRIHLFNTMGPSGDGIIPAAQASNPAITFGALDYNPVSGNQDEEYIEIVNANNVAVDISDWTVAVGVTHTFAKGTVIPANSKLYLTPSSSAFRNRSVSPKGGESLFVQSSYNGHLSSFGETLELYDQHGTLVDSHTYAGTPSEEQLYIVVSEIMYHPVNPDAEYIELLNISTTESVDLTDVRFTNGITFNFTGSAITSLAPGERVLVVKNLAVFESTYGTGLPVAGVWTGSLDNDGETIKLEDATNSTIKEFTYNDALPWPLSPDGQEASLVLKDPDSNPDHNIATNWRSSSLSGGTPGSGETISPPPANGTADNDGNGIADIIDYAISGNPTPGIINVDTSDYLTLQFTQNIAAESANVLVQYSENLSHWTSGDTAVELVSETFNNNGTVTYLWRSIKPLTNPTRQFMRLEVTAP